MNRMAQRMVLRVLLIALPMSVSAHGEDAVTLPQSQLEQMLSRFDEQAIRLEQAEREIEQLRSGLSRMQRLPATDVSYSFNEASYEAADFDASSISGCDGYCGNARGWFGFAEGVFVKPHFENGHAFFEPTYDLEASLRFGVGYRTATGWGLRSSYWSSQFGAPVALNGLSTLLEMQVADLDITKSVCWGPLQAEFFGGLRYAGIDHTEIVGGTNFSQVDGFGPRVGIDTRTPIGSTSLSVLGRFHFAGLYGTVNDSAFGNQTDIMFSVAEVQLGLDYTRCVGRGEASVYVMAEAQNWLAATTNVDGIDDVPDEDLGLIGFTAGGQYRY